MTSVLVLCHFREYPDKYGISDFLWKIHPNRGCCDADLCIPMWGPFEDVFYLTIFQDSLYAAKLIRVRGSLSVTVVGNFRCIKNVFNAGSVLPGQTHVPSRIAYTSGPSSKTPAFKYNRGSSRNGQAPLVWWYFFKFYVIITFSSRILSVIYSVLPLVCCSVKS